MKIFITCALTAMFILLDLLAGNIGLFPGFSVYGALVLFMAYRWQYGVASAVIGGIIIDILYGHSAGGLTFIFTLSVIAGALIAERGHRQIAALFAAGCCTGFIVASGVILTVKLTGGSIPAPDSSSFLIFSTGAGGLWLIILTLLFDFFAARANLPRCITVSNFNSPRRHAQLHRSRNNTTSARKRRR